MWLTQKEFSLLLIAFNCFLNAYIWQSRKHSFSFFTRSVNHLFFSFVGKNPSDGSYSHYIARSAKHLYKEWKAINAPPKKGLGFSLFVFRCPLLVKSGSGKTTDTYTRFLPNGFCGALRVNTSHFLFLFLKLFIACGFEK